MDQAQLQQKIQGAIDRRRLAEEFGDGFIGVEIDSSPGNEHRISKRAHSVLTDELVDEPGHPTRDALDAVLEHLRVGLLA